MPLDWNDLRLFVLVARTGGLAAAARAAGLSPPTVGRRLQALETALDRRLFDRLPGGYVLTAEGRALLAEAGPLETAVIAIERWRDRDAEGRAVRVSAGTFTSRFLARHIAELVAPGDPFRLVFLPAEERLDIGRRAADIGIRSRRPDEAWLAGQRIGGVAFALYGAAKGPMPEGFVAATTAASEAGRWLRARHGAAITVEASSPRTVLDLARAGAGRALLPCFVGDLDPGLVRLAPPIAELGSEQWLVLHHDDRHTPAVRTVARRIARLLRAHRASFEGRAPAE